ncbi:Type 1 glutamine amidotransferase-like domain-containing protein [Rhizobium sp. RU36D]|uniref:Type 1 glutamine amidotransferase-like domain-containing protein n=1 Tax=Rhizobium sp. RU36D TaxID=1907415 RepID=UPI0009D7EA74|nr:Type 1 glutamine amidotransferase-like domain-containing protein [Rhizobium sp. RU36D]SMD18953.1 dipeptidase E [Rhizobium sp. RU36D]
MYDSLRLFLYSDQVIAQNARIDNQLLQLINRGSGRRIGYIPSGPDPDRRFVADRRRYYAKYGLEIAVVYDLDVPQTPDDLASLLSCDALHLSGGHTMGFLTRLRRAGMIDVLREYASSGGLLVGTSAGAILMTPTIAVDALFSGGRPEEVREGDALGLVPFEFFPHCDAKPSYLTQLLSYSTVTPRPIMAVRDGDGIVVAAGIAHCVGGAILIKDGMMMRSVECVDLGTMEPV